MDSADALRRSGSILRNEERFPVFSAAVVDTNGYGDIVEPRCNAGLLKHCDIRAECTLLHGALTINPNQQRYETDKGISLETAVESLRIAYYTALAETRSLFPGVELSPQIPYIHSVVTREETLERIHDQAGWLMKLLHKLFPPMESTVQRTLRAIEGENIRKIYDDVVAALGTLRAELHMQEGRVIAQIRGFRERREAEEELRPCSLIIIGNGGSVMLIVSGEEVRIAFDTAFFPESGEEVRPADLTVPGLRCTYLGRNRFLFVEATDEYIPFQTSPSRCTGPVGVVWVDEPGE